MTRLLKNLLFIAPFLLSISLYAANEYIVQNIIVDVTDESAVQAQEKAFLEGEVSAFQTLLQKMVAPTDLSKLPALTPQQIKSLITSFSVQEEKRSDVRYIATLQYMFNGNLIRKYLQTYAVNFSESLVRPVLLVPVYNPVTSHASLQDLFQQAWEQIDPKQYTVPFIVAPISSALEEFKQDNPRTLERLHALGQTHKAPYIALIKYHGEVKDFSAPENDITANIRIYPSALEQPDYTIKIEPVSISHKDGLKKVAELIHQGIVEIEKSHLAQKEEDQTIIKETMELVVPTKSISQWYQNLHKIQIIPNLTISNIRSISKSKAHIIVQVPDINYLTQQLSQKRFQVEPNGNYLILHTSNDAA